MAVKPMAFRKLADALAVRARSVEVAIDDRGYLGGSEIGGCARRVVQTHLNHRAGQAMTRKLLNECRLKLGDVVEEYVVRSLQEALKGSQTLLLEHTLDDQIELTGTHCKMHPDGLFVLREGVDKATPLAYLEVKSCGENSFKNQGERPYPEYLVQVTGEMHYSAPNMTMLVAARLERPEDWHVHVVPYDTGAGEAFAEREAYIAGHIEAGELPEGEPTTLCGFCPFKAACPSASARTWRDTPKQVEGEIVKPTKALQAKLRRYLDLKAKADDLETQMKRIREEVDGFLTKKGARGFDYSGIDQAESLPTVSYTKPRESRRLSEALVAKALPPEKLAECYEVRIGEPTLRIAPPRKRKGSKASKEKAQAVAMQMVAASGKDAESGGDGGPGAIEIFQ